MMASGRKRTGTEEDRYIKEEDEWEKMKFSLENKEVRESRGKGYGRKYFRARLGSIEEEKENKKIIVGVAKPPPNVVVVLYFFIVFFVCLLTAVFIINILTRHKGLFY
jgi:hypothetical protein